MRPVLSVILLSLGAEAAAVGEDAAEQVELWLTYSAWLAALVSIGAAALVLYLYGRHFPSKLDGQARRDALTGLLNRDGLIDRLEVLIDQAEAAGSGVSVMLLDLNDFKAVNEAFGRLAGDQILSVCAARLQLATSGICELAHLHGDKFVALVPHEQPGELERLARLFADAFERPIRAPEGAARLTVSIGIARYRKDHLHRKTFLLAADAALTSAKRVGKNTCRFYAAKRQARHDRSPMPLEDVSAPWNPEAFTLHYQRKVSILSGKVVGYEALPRQKTAEGIRGAGEVLATAARCGPNIAIDEWAIRAAASQSLEWRRAGFVSPIAVNVSGIQLRDPRLVKLMTELITADPDLPKLLALEMPESSLSLNPEDELSNAEKLSDLGVAIHVCPSKSAFPDAARFSHLPVGAIKIDRSLVSQLPANEGARETIEWVVAVAGALGITVVAEGVETKEQLRFLRCSGCHEAQGYLFDYPIPPKEVIRRSFLRAEG